MAQTAPKCAHEPCKCSVTEGKRYCCEHCEQHARQGDQESKVMCGCGHPECGGTVSAS
jgi:hypothetical protein